MGNKLDKATDMVKTTVNVGGKVVAAGSAVLAILGALGSKKK